MATVINGPTWNFQVLTGASVATKRISWKSAFGDLRSGQFCDLTMIRHRQNVLMPFIPKVRVGAYLLYQACLDDPYELSAPAGQWRSAETPVKRGLTSKCSLVCCTPFCIIRQPRNPYWLFLKSMDSAFTYIQNQISRPKLPLPRDLKASNGRRRSGSSLYP